MYNISHLCLKFDTFFCFIIIDSSMQERILLDRDRVVSKTWYNEDKSRWEMDPVAVPYAVSNKLVESARIRHDWGAMFLSLKGDDKEFYVDIKVIYLLYISLGSMIAMILILRFLLQEFEVLFEDFGGFDELYMKMLACGIPTAVQLMRIPFSELDFYQQFLLIVRLAYLSLNGLWKTGTVSFWRDLIFENIRNTNDDIMMLVVFPLLDRIIPYSVLILSAYDHSLAHLDTYFQYSLFFVLLS